MSQKSQEYHFVSIIIPVFNEQKTVRRIIDKCLSSLKKLSNEFRKRYQKLEYELIVVNDGSTDETEKILKKFNRNKNIFIYSLPDNQGKGAALRHGFSKAKGDIFVTQDADLEYHPKYYSRLLKPILENKSKVVYGSRLSNLPLSLKTIYSIKLPINFIANKVLSFLTTVLYGQYITDMETGYKAFTRKAFKKIKLDSKGFDIEVELTAKLIQAGFKIKEVPITTKPRDYNQGKKITYQDGIVALFKLIKYRLNQG